MCVLDGEGSRLFARKALVKLDSINGRGSDQSSYSDCLTGLCEPLPSHPFQKCPTRSLCQRVARTEKAATTGSGNFVKDVDAVSLLSDPTSTSVGPYVRQK